MKAGAERRLVGSWVGLWPCFGRLDCSTFPPAACARLDCCSTLRPRSVFWRCAALRTLALNIAPLLCLSVCLFQLVSRLGGDLPVAVDEEVWEDAAEELDDIFVGDADIWR